MAAAAWGEAANAAIQLGTAWLNSDSQRHANATNVKMQKSQQDWEQMMSNTATQRKANDIERAGGNRALAFTNGMEASTPIVQPAHVDPVHFDSPHINTAALIQASLAKGQADLLRSEAIKNSADARATTLDTDIREAGADLEVKYKGLGSAQDYLNKQAQGRNLESQIALNETDRVARQIANFVANNSAEDVISALKSDAIIRAAHINPAELSSKWAQTKKAVLDNITRGYHRFKQDSETDYGPLHPDFIPPEYK